MHERLETEENKCPLSHQYQRQRPSSKGNIENALTNEPGSSRLTRRQGATNR